MLEPGSSWLYTMPKEIKSLEATLSDNNSNSLICVMHAGTNSVNETGNRQWYTNVAYDH